MTKIFTTLKISTRLWLLTAVAFAIAFTILFLFGQNSESFFLVVLFALIAALAGSLPVFILYLVILPFIQSIRVNFTKKIGLLLLSMLLVAIGYAVIPALLRVNIFKEVGRMQINDLHNFICVTLLLIMSAAIATVLSIKQLEQYLSVPIPLPDITNLFSQNFTQTKKTTIIMDTEKVPLATANPQDVAPTKSNSILIKGIVTGVLILVMLIPTFFINNLITERENRQKDVVKEVSSKWAEAQTLSAPFITVPYTTQFTDADGKLKNATTNLILLADQLNVNGVINPEIRPRSIYKVLLYKSQINFKGSFKPEWPADINLANVDFTKARLCFALSDYKGIEEEIFIIYNNEKLLLNPSLPITDLGEVGLSTPLTINAEQLKTGVPFNMQIKLKGSEQLHFLPLSSNSTFTITSSWASPSFDGNSLPNTRTYNDSGFVASWNFNRANLPFGTVVREGALKVSTTAFGVTLVQPADQYNKTSRSVKYAILLIGLTFALFFIIELMQKKPLHPVQYILVGMALVIFYTLLLSISEYIIFDYAYCIAAGATVLLISFYAKGHFKNWKSASIFAALLSCLYGFIFVLIRLEDTALLVGSIGLFIILALVMYGSRKINWYGTNPIQN